MQELSPTLQNRYFTVDLLRGIALLGILMMNIPYFALPESTFHHQIYAHLGDTNYKTNFVVSVLFEGKMRALFSILFGASVLLFTARKEEASGGSLFVADLYYRRMLWLIVFGVVDAFFLLWFGDILYWYGLVGLLLFTVRNSPAKRLLIGAFLCFAFLAFKGWWGFAEGKEKHEKYKTAMALVKQQKTLTDEQKADTTAWKNGEKERKYDPKQAEKEIKEMRGNYAKVWNHVRPMNVMFQSTYFYLYFWDELGMMLLGMALFKMGVLTNKASQKTYWLLLLLGYGIGIPLGAYVVHFANDAITNYALYIDSNWVNPERLTYDIRRFFMALGHIGLTMLLFRTGIFGWLLRPLAAVGQMALSNYVLHTLICTAIFFGYGFGYFGHFQYYQLFYFVAAIWVANIIFSVIWLNYFQFGPVEWLWRSLTYWKKQPMRR